MTDNFWSGRSVLVTGASGLLGSWMVKELVRRDAQVVALIRDGRPHSELVQGGMLQHVDTVYGSVTDLGLIRRTLAEYSVQTVFHLAAQTLVGVAKMDPLSTLDTNIRGSWNVLEAARQCGKAQVLVASSDKAYGASDQLPYLETHPLQGKYPYDASKSCVDLLTTMYAATYGLPTGIVRCANLFGGGDLNFSRTIPGVILATLRGERFVIRSDGLFVRDYLYVADGVQAYLTLAEHLASDPSLSGQAFNFSLGIRLTVLGLVETVLRLLGRDDLRPIIQNNASSEVREQYACSDKAREVLGWEPRHTLEDGLAQTIDWYRGMLSQTSLTRAEPAAAAAR